MILGSTYSTVKTAIRDTLAARAGLADVAVSYEPPADPLNVQGEAGNGLAIWIADAEGQDDNVVLGAPGLWIDETYDLTLVIQALPVDSDDTQEVLDRRVDEMLGEILAQTAASANWGITAFVHLQITRGGWQRFVGPIPGSGIYASKCELQLLVEGRIRFDGTA